MTPTLYLIFALSSGISGAARFMFSNANGIGVCARQVLSLARSFLRCKYLNIVDSVVRRA